MKTEKRCPGCETALPEDAVEGLCPACLMAGAVNTTMDEMRPPGALGNIRYFGDYQLLEEIARGGMGVVYKARQVTLNRMVAIKTILAGQLATEAQVARFRVEAEAAANLQHPNIVSIHEVGVCDGQHYFSMDYVDGRNLAETVGAVALQPGRAATLMKQIAEAVHHGHQRGTYHRDLKPQNVLIDSDGQPRVTDFGLAKREGVEADLTKTGAVLGTPAYMPPEQAAGRMEQAGPESDVYSLGAILYFVLTGRPPFTGKSSLEVLRQVVDSEPTPLTAMDARIPRDLETICLKCLEKDMARRYRSARELADDLGRFLADQPIVAEPAGGLRRLWSWSIRNPWAIAAGASAVLLAAVALAYGLWQRNLYLNWKIAHPGRFPTPPRGLIENFSFALLQLYSPILAGLPWWDLVTRRQRNLAITTRHLAAYTAVGSFMFAYGLFWVIKWVEAWAWKFSKRDVWYEEPVILALSFGFASLGLLVVFEALKERLASRKASKTLVVPATRQSGFVPFFEDLASGIGLSDENVKLGPIAVSRGGLAIGIIFCLALITPVVVGNGWWWSLQFFLGGGVAGSCIMLGAARGGVRFYYIFVFLMLAGIAATSWGRLIFVGWVAWCAGVVFNLVLTSFGKPANSEPRFSVFRLVPTFLLLAGFFWFAAPANDKPKRHGLTAMGVVMLAAAGWWIARPRGHVSGPGMEQDVPA